MTLSVVDSLGGDPDDVAVLGARRQPRRRWWPPGVSLIKKFFVADSNGK
jgi:hypothetical protein